MSQQSVKEFGLKYIEEMAKEREISKQEVSISILSLKNTIKPVREFTYEDFDGFVEASRNQVIRIFDGEFTKLTIKSLSKIRQLITGSSGFSLDDTEVSKSELDKALKEVNLLNDSLYILKNEKVKEKADFELKIENYTKANEELEEKINTLTLNEKKLYSQIQSAEQQLNSSRQQITELTKDLSIKNKTLEQLVEQNKLTEDDLQLMSENMDKMLQSSEEASKRQLEDTIQRVRNELSFEYDLTVNDLENKLEKQKQLYSDLDKRYKELEENHKTFVESNLALKQEYAELSDRIEAGGKTLNFIQSMLSTHPLYSAVLILANLGGTMPLDKLAKSVGANPLRLRHLLNELAERRLIDISEGENPIVTIVRNF